MATGFAWLAFLWVVVTLAGGDGDPRGPGETGGGGAGGGEPVTLPAEAGYIDVPATVVGPAYPARGPR